MIDQIEAPRLVKGLAPEDIAFIISDQLNLANYLHPPEELPLQPDKTYADNQSLWADVLAKKLRARLTLQLTNFLLCDWFPRSPGLFYTDKARQARQEAQYFRESAPESTADTNLENQYQVDDDAPDFTYIYNPYGKLSMLKGGIGSVRLCEKEIREGVIWFMSASQTPVAHEGFPVALPDDLYQRYYDQLHERGFMACTLVGKLQNLPQDLDVLYKDYTGVPRLYLLVEELRPLPTPDLNQPFRVSVATSFVSDFESPGWNRMYAAYVTFYPHVHGSLERRVDWLENRYVKSRYQGKIVTDFDEREFHFPNVAFSLDKVMTNNLNTMETKRWLESIHDELNLWPEFADDVAQMQANLHLHRVLCDHFNLEEFRNLCFQLGVRYDHLRGEALPGKARELLLHCQQHNQMPDLIEAIQQTRPHLSLSQ
ncbi:MAG: hypothetical protein P8183_11090 [Anaerolineae bacterium]